jgi:hypothetical protein
MRAGIVAAVLVACAPASADPATYRIGLLCAGTMPLVVVIETSGPVRLSVRIDDAFDACVADLQASKQWQGRS